jgi:hypothetical protein
MRKEFAPMLLDFAGMCELGYLEKIFSYLEKELDDDYLFIIGRTNTLEEHNQMIEFLKNKEGKLYYIYLADEFQKTPEYLNKFIKVFRTYNRKDLYDNKHIFPIPCGYSSGHRNGWYEGEKEKSLLKNRTNDLFYSGQNSTPDRNDLISRINEIKNNYKHIINISNGFSFGYQINEYYDILQNSKISLVPKGAVVPESFRFFESFESNCVVISTYSINNLEYKHWYYDDCPAIFLNNWNELNKEMINNILYNIEEYQEKNKNYYNNKLSSKAIANYILENI